MIRDFVSKTKYSKLLLLEELFSDTHSTDVLIQNLNIPLATIKRYLYELETEFSSNNLRITFEFPNPQTVQLSDVSNNYGVLMKDQLLRELRYKYLEESFTFKLAEILCSGRNLTVDMLQKELLISQSHTYKIIKDLKAILKEWLITLSFNKLGVLELSGNEINIRIFIYSFITTCFPNNIWFFKNLSKHQILNDIHTFSRLKHLPAHSKNRLCIFFAVLQSRLLKEKRLELIKSELHTQFEHFEYLSLYEIKNYLIEKRMLDSADQYNEYLHINYFLRLFIGEVIEESDEQKIGQRISKSETEADCFYQGLLDFWENEYSLNLSSKNKNIFLYMCGLISTAIFFPKINLLKFFRLTQFHSPNSITENNNTLDQLRDLLESYITESIHDLPTIEKYVPQGFPYMLNFLFYFTKLFVSKNIVIFLYFTNDFTATDYLKQKIKNYFNSDIISFTSHTELADLIITDTYDFFPIQEKSILIPDLFQNHSLVEIFERINHTLVDKNFL